MFIDEARIEVFAGDGGHGMVAFRKEKYVPRGGPSGGDGGRGGDVVFVARANVTTLAMFRYKRHIRADHGRPGGPKNMTGRSGKTLEFEVPLGTIIFDDETGQKLVDLTEDDQRFVAAKGGDGGQGNQHFATPRNRAPRRATAGWPGQKVVLRLELKLLADVGLVGFPSVGKSTLITALSSARPKIASYPFTTLVPNLGVVSWRDWKEYVIADIPGLIEGAHRGEGLGIQFLKHVERTNLLLHVLEVTPQLEGQEDGRDPIQDYELLCKELEAFNPELLERPQMAVLNKIDLPFVQAQEPRVREYFEAKGIDFLSISAAASVRLDTLRDLLGEAVFGSDSTTHPSRTLEWWEGGDRAPETQQEE